MTAKDYTSTAATASRLIGKFGQAVTLTAKVVAGYIPGSGAPTLGSPTVQTGSGVVDAYVSREIDGTRIKAGDVKLLLSPLNAAGAPLTAPGPGSKAAVGGVTYEVVNVETTAPAGPAVLYTLQLRK